MQTNIYIYMYVVCVMNIMNNNLPWSKWTRQIPHTSSPASHDQAATPCQALISTRHAIAIRPYVYKYKYKCVYYIILYVYMHCVRTRVGYLVRSVRFILFLSSFLFYRRDGPRTEGGGERGEGGIDTCKGRR